MIFWNFRNYSKHWIVFFYRKQLLFMRFSWRVAVLCGQYLSLSIHWFKIYIKQEHSYKMMILVVNYSPILVYQTHWNLTTVYSQLLYVLLYLTLFVHKKRYFKETKHWCRRTRSRGSALKFIIIVENSIEI
jgi:hypothetical protein